MRTTLDLDDSVLAAAREIAEAGRCSVGEVVSELIREALQNRARNQRLATRSGVPLLHSTSDHIVTDELIDRIRGEECV